MSTSASSFQAPPSVQITFDGLMLFTFEKDSSQCVIGAVKCVNHCLEITIDDEKPIIAPAKNISILSDSPKGIRQYRPGGDRIRHSSPNGDLNDLGWLMAIQGDQFHNNKDLPKNSNGIEQVITVNTGIFYTALRTSDVSIISKNGASESSTIATTVGCNINLELGETLTLAFDGVVAHQFTKTEKNRKIRVVYTCNDPVFEPDFGDFRAYYRIYDTVPAGEQFGIAPTRILQEKRGLGIQEHHPSSVCPPAEGEPPIG
jgi:hypothetical protein